LSCFLREKEREICVSFEQQRKEGEIGESDFSKRENARFLKNNPRRRRRRRRRRRERLKTRTTKTTTTTTKNEPDPSLSS
jgi:hypothetical protein